MSTRPKQFNGSPGGHLDEMTCLLYLEGQLDRARGREVSDHAEECAGCRTLLRALERESRLLTRALIEEEESLPARLLEAPGRRVRSMQWVWVAAFSLAASGVYALYTGYIEPWQQQLEQAGFGGTNLLGLLIFQGAFWKGWQSMISLLEILALVTLAGFGVAFLRRRVRRGSALAMVLAGLCAATIFPATASAAECRKEQMYTLGKDEVIKNDLYLSAGRARIEGTVEGDLIVFAESLEVSGHVAGDVIVFARTGRVTGQVDGNIRAFTNTMTISGAVGRNVMSFTESLNVDSSAKIGGGVTVLGGGGSFDGRIGRDLMAFIGRGSVTGYVGGDLRMKGGDLTIASTAEVAGKSRFDGKKEPIVSPQAKLASPMEYHHLEHDSEYRSGKYYVWRLIWTAATFLFGMVLFLLMQQFARDTVGSAGRYGASFGLGVLVLFGVPIAAIIACVTVVGIPLAVSALVLWLAALFCSQIAVGAIVGQWLMGRTAEIWPLIGRMGLGLVIIRVIATVPKIGPWVKLAILLWGMGAISLAVYRRFQTIIPAAPAAPAIGGAQTT